MWCTSRWVSSVVLVASLFALRATAQQVEAPAWIDDEQLEQQLEQACAALRESQAPVALADLVARLDRTSAVPFPEEPLATASLALPDLRDRVLRSLRIVGHHYKCTECADWHVNAASGFCIDRQGTIATCRHVVAPDDTMRDAALFVADLQGRVWFVQDVLVADAASDVVLLRTGERDTVPMPMRGDVRAGERVYCASHPDHQFGFFSEGLVARRFRAREAVAGDETRVARLARRAQDWLHVTTDFAKGSSGGPIVDGCGNLVGIAQSTSTVVYDPDAKPIDTQMVFKIATPASAVLALRAPTASPKRTEGR